MALGIGLTTLSMFAIGTGVPILLTGGIWIIVGAALVMSGALGMGIGFSYLTSARERSDTANDNDLPRAQ